MPLRSYALSVGGALLALLFAADALLPRPSTTGIVSGAERPTIRIYSQRKGPEAIVFDTSQPPIAPSITARPEANVAEATVVAPEAAVRSSFAQIAPVRPAQKSGDGPGKIKAGHSHKRDVAAIRARHSLRFAAETPRFDFFRMNW